MTFPALGRKLVGAIEYLLAVLVVLGFLAGWAVGIGLVFDLRDLYAAQAWPAKQGVITHSYVRQVRGYMNRPFWHAEIAGRYVDGSGTFGVSRHAYGIQNSVITRAQAQAVTKRYPKGAMLDLYPKPDQPRTAILDPNASPTPSWIALAVSIGLIVLPFALYLFGRVRREKPRGRT